MGNAFFVVVGVVLYLGFCCPETRFRYRTASPGNYRPWKIFGMTCFVRLAGWASKNSAQKLALNIFSSLENKDFREDVMSHGRFFLTLVLLYRKV